jgi:hypothetical protein
LSLAVEPSRFGNALTEGGSKDGSDTGRSGGGGRVLGDRGAASEHARHLRRDPAGRLHGRDGPHHRRERHGEGARGGGVAQAVTTRLRTLRAGALRRDSGGAARKRDVRARARRVHGRGHEPRRPLQARRRRHDLPGRDRRDEPEAAGEAAARARGRPLRAGRLRRHAAGRRAHHRGDEPHARAGRRGEAVPRGSVLSPPRRADRDPAATPASRGHSAARRAHARRARREGHAAFPRAAHGDGGPLPLQLARQRARAPEPAGAARRPRPRRPHDRGPRPAAAPGGAA